MILVNLFGNIICYTIGFIEMVYLGLLFLMYIVTVKHCEQHYHYTYLK